MTFHENLVDFCFRFIATAISVFWIVGMLCLFAFFGGTFARMMPPGFMEIMFGITGIILLMLVYLWVCFIVAVWTPGRSETVVGPITHIITRD